MTFFCSGLYADLLEEKIKETKSIITQTHKSSSA